ncbi:14884_t:CDS:1, partial [Funneliformis geosporum]
MALVASIVTSFKWTIEVARELIQLRRENHDDFEFVPNNRYERIWRTISNQLFLNKGFVAFPSQYRRKWYSLKYG